MRAILAVLFLTAALSGCLGGVDEAPEEPPTPVSDEWWIDALPDGSDGNSHDHTDVLAHMGLSTPNFKTVGHNDVVTAYHGASSGAYYCGEVSTEGDRILAAYNSFNTDVALVIMDVTDPADPQLVGELILRFVHTYDAAISDDGRWALLATNPTDTGPDEGLPIKQAKIQAVFRDACGNEYEGPEDDIPANMGVVLVDIADPSNPVVADYRPTPAIGAHSVAEYTIDGVSYVVGSTTNLEHRTSYFSFFKIEETPAGGVLAPAGQWSSQYPSTDISRPPPLINGHVDAAIQKHPVTGAVLAYLANWDGGLNIIEETAPGVWTPVAEWREVGAVHGAVPLPDLWNDRHITLIGQEGGNPGNGRASLWIIMMDTTDPADPQALATWTLPVEALQWGGFLMFSTHYMVMVEETMFVAMYHGGVWAVDASEENWPLLPSKGVFIPAKEMDPLPVGGGLAPEVLDVNVLPGGELLIMDNYSGAFVVEFDETVDVPPAPPLDITPEWLE